MERCGIPFFRLPREGELGGSGGGGDAREVELEGAWRFGIAAGPVLAPRADFGRRGDGGDVAKVSASKCDADTQYSGDLGIAHKAAGGHGTARPLAPAAIKAGTNHFRACACGFPTARP